MNPSLSPSPTLAPLDPSIDVSIVIVNWNARDFLRNCLRSITDQTARSHQIIVVDNASKDASADMIRAEFPGVTLIANNHNAGFAAANNQGIAVSRGRHVLLLNPDTVILDHAIDQMLAESDKRPDVGVIGCQVWETPERIQRVGFAFPHPFNIAIIQTGLTRKLARWPLFNLPAYGNWNRDTERDLDVISGMFMLVKRAVIEKVGVLDPDYFVYAEEADWCRRIWRAGYRCVFIPTAKILHIDGGGKSTDQVSVKMYVQLQKSLTIFNRKNYGPFAAFLVRIIYTLAMTGRGILFSLSALFDSSGRSARRAKQSWAAVAWHVLKRAPTT